MSIILLHLGGILFIAITSVLRRVGCLMAASRSQERQKPSPQAVILVGQSTSVVHRLVPAEPALKIQSCQTHPYGPDLPRLDLTSHLGEEERFPGLPGCLIELYD